MSTAPNLARWFTRDNERRVWALVDDAPAWLGEWVRDEVHDHASVLPSDVLYSVARDACVALDDAVEADDAEQVACYLPSYVRRDALALVNDTAACDRVIAHYVDTFGGSLEFDDVAHLFDVLAEALTWFAQHLAEQLAVSQLGVEL